MERSKLQFQGLADGGRDELVRDGDGQLLGDEGLGVFLGYVEGFTGSPSPRLGGEDWMKRTGLTAGWDRKC
jgi:hypothetical protein